MTVGRLTKEMSEQENLLTALPARLPPISVAHPPSTSQEVARVAFKAPPFWRKNPKLYFAQIESQFVIAGITRDETKYHHAVAAIETDVIALVSDIILNPPEEDKYETLKTRLIEHFSDSETHRIKMLLQELQLGDERPSQLLRKMKDLSSTCPEDLLRTLWLQRLPVTVQQILATNTGSLDDLAKMADKIVAVYSPECATVNLIPSDTASVASENPVASLESQISLLTRKLDHFSLRRSRSKDRYLPRSRSRSRSNTSERNVCWYHFRFGPNARKCQPPCEYSTLQKEN